MIIIKINNVDAAKRISDIKLTLTGIYINFARKQGKTKFTEDLEWLIGQAERTQELEEMLKSRFNHLGVQSGCWLIEFKNGYKIILSESVYAEEVARNFSGKEVLCEQHWFDIRTCLDRNRGVRGFGIYKA